VGGPTGAGKTILADLLIGLLEPDSGEITARSQRRLGSTGHGGN